MSSNSPSEDELSRLIAEVMKDKPPSKNPPIETVREQERTVVSQDNEDTSYKARVNRLTFLEQGAVSGDSTGGDRGTSLYRRDTESLFIDLTAGGMEGSEGGLQMMSARSTGNSTIETVGETGPLMYEIYQFPSNIREVEKLCLQRQTGGITACIRTNCRLNHRGPRMDIRSGTVVVAKSACSVFIDPKTDMTNVSPSLLAEWKNTSRTLDEWNELFRLVNTREQTKAPFTTEVLNQVRNFSEFARDWKSPGTKLGSLVGSILGKKSSEFSTLVEEETLNRNKELLEESDIVFDDDLAEPNVSPSAMWVFKRLESKVDVNISVVGKLSERLDERADTVNEELMVLFSRIQQTENVIGPKVLPANPQFNAPSIWGSISTLAGAFDELRSDLLEVKADVIRESVSLEKRMSDSVEEQLSEVVNAATVMISDQLVFTKDCIDQQASSIAGSKESILMLARGAAKLKDEISELRKLVNEIKGSSGGGAGGTNLTDESTVLSDISSLKVMVRSIVQRVDNVVEGREAKAIKFFGVTFRGHTEAESWVFDNLDNESFGLIVDVHLVLEHVYHQAFSDDGSVKELNGLFKIKIDNITQGLAISSFDCSMPKFFSVAPSAANKKPKIRKPDSSHFDNIDNYEDWDLPIMGFRAKLKDHLEEFEETHVRMIGEVLSPDEPAYRIATMSVQTSVSWIQSFIAYLDETYLDTARLQSFTPARAWQLVTQIGRRILHDVAAPRTGVRKLFRVGDNTKIAQAMFWPMVQSHELMTRYKKANFKDDPSVSNEFMKFMATNSGSTDGLALMTSKLVKIEGEVKDAVKLAKGANNGITSSANKVDNLQKLVTQLTSRVSGLEKK